MVDVWIPDTLGVVVLMVTCSGVVDGAVSEVWIPDTLGVSTEPVDALSVGRLLAVEADLSRSDVEDQFKLTGRVGVGRVLEINVEG